MSTANVSSGLIWNLVRNFNSKQVTRHNGFKNTTFSKEKGNLLNLNSPKFSALSNPVSFHIKQTKTGFELSKRRRRFANRPVKSLQKSVQNRANRKQKIASTLAGLTTTRSTLKVAAQRRWERVYRNNRRNTRRNALIQKSKKGEKKSTETKNINDVN
eukprot:TRINITY_DN460_c1_g1_i1.p1 TRINITY_DN460_c1_g1~~TRINITY_DN460_c1_g1_i1.p1  ORF type:complete len:172 (+),score=49.58 TRINITY_DN460_c1_g1_i1:45-518(+)